MMEENVSPRMLEYHLARARIATVGASRLMELRMKAETGDRCSTIAQDTALADLQLLVAATLRLADAWLGHGLDQDLRAIVLAALQTNNLSAWLHADGAALSHYFLLVDAVDTVIGDSLTATTVEYYTFGTHRQGQRTSMQLCISDEGMRCAQALTDGNHVLAAHVLLGAAHLALTETA